MKLLIYRLLYLFTIAFLFSCGNSKTQNDGSESIKKDPVALQAIPASQCVKNIIYIKSGQEIDHYDSISTLYFHKLEDYVDQEAKTMSRQLDSLKKILHTREMNNEAENSFYISKIDSLRQELNPFQKFTVGYAFVHTYKLKNDTISAIFVMDTLCAFGEMTVLKDVLLVDPIDDAVYSEKVKKGKGF